MLLADTAIPCSCVKHGDTGRSGRVGISSLSASLPVSREGMQQERVLPAGFAANGRHSQATPWDNWEESAADDHCHGRWKHKTTLLVEDEVIKARSISCHLTTCDALGRLHPTRSGEATGLLSGTNLTPTLWAPGLIYLVGRLSKAL
jgi:hypothetical protein